MVRVELVGRGRDIAAGGVCEAGNAAVAHPLIAGNEVERFAQGKHLAAHAVELIRERGSGHGNYSLILPVPRSHQPG